MKDCKTTHKEHFWQHSFVRYAIPEVLFQRRRWWWPCQAWYHIPNIPNIHMGTPIICIPATWKSPWWRSRTGAVTAIWPFDSKRIRQDALGGLRPRPCQPKTNITSRIPTVLPHQIAVAHQVNGLRPITTSGPFAKAHPQNQVEAISISLANAWMETIQ